MVGWFAKATDALRRRGPPEPQPFELVCRCNHRLTGVRQTAYQTVPCNRCGSILFVLPTDVYPEPKKKAAKKKAVPQPSPATARGLSRDVGPETEMGVKVAVQERHAATTTEPVAAPASRRGVAVRAEPEAVIARVRSRIVTPFRLIVLAVIAVVGTTGYFVWQSRLKDFAARDLPVQLAAGDAALQHGEMREAAEAYQRASHAVDRLGRQDAESLGIRQKAKELNAIANLSPISLYDICEEAHRAATTGDLKWNETFDQLYRDAWIIVDGEVIQETSPDIQLPDDSKANATAGKNPPGENATFPAVRYPFPIDGAPVVFDARLPAIEPILSGGTSKRVVFAGQLASMTRQGQKSPVWIIRFKEASAFPWVHAETYRALGLGLGGADVRGNDGTAQLLERQAEALGLKAGAGTKP